MLAAARSVSTRNLVVVGLDALVAAAAWTAALLLRFNLEAGALAQSGVLVTLIYALPVQIAAFLALGLHRIVWRHVSLVDLKRISVTVVAALASTGMAVIFASHHPLVPRTVWILDGVFLFLGLAGLRVLFRLYWTYGLLPVGAKDGSPTLVLGELETCPRILDELGRLTGHSVRGILLDAPAAKGGLIYGCPVLGPVSDLGHWAKKLGVRTAVLAMPASTSRQRRAIVEGCRKAGIELLSVPCLVDILDGRIEFSTLRKIDVEDLLGREPVSLDSTGLRDMIEGRVVLVTGAGGSIGSELCRQLAGFDPGRLVFFDHSEPALYQLEQEFLERPGSDAISFVPIVGDVKDRARLDWVMEEFAPSMVFHAAAYKHVPLMERNNAWEALQNNVRGTYTLAKAAIDHRVDRFVLVSTDKAVNPTNVMGASKRLAEMICQSLGESSPTRFITVRFGNVIASQGSVIPKFREQLIKGGPLTVTSPEITRYFMSIPEASQLVLQSALAGEGGEVFVLDMGTPVRIADLARDMIKLAGFSEDEIKIEFTGLRPGEKMHEELLADGEDLLATSHPRLRIARARRADQRRIGEMMALLLQERVLSDEEVKSVLSAWIPEAEFEPAVPLPPVPPRPPSGAPLHIN